MYITFNEIICRLYGYYGNVEPSKFKLNSFKELFYHNFVITKRYSSIGATYIKLFTSYSCISYVL